MQLPTYAVFGITAHPNTAQPLYSRRWHMMQGILTRNLRTKFHILSHCKFQAKLPASWNVLIKVTRVHQKYRNFWFAKRLSCKVSSWRSSKHAGAYGNGVLEPTTAAALSLTPQLESDVKGSTADVSEAVTTYPTSHGSEVQRFFATRAIGLGVFAHTSFFLPQNRLLLQAPLFGRRRFSLSSRVRKRHGFPERSAKKQQHCIDCHCSRSFAVTFTLLGAKHPASIRSAEFFDIIFVMKIYLIRMHFPHSFTYDLFIHLRCASAAPRVLGLWVRIHRRRCSQVVVSATDRSLVQRSPTDSVCVCVCVCVCARARFIVIWRNNNPLHLRVIESGQNKKKRKKERQSFIHRLMANVFTYSKWYPFLYLGAAVCFITLIFP